MSGNSETKPYEGLIKDLERIHRREKVCKKTINDNIGNIITSLQQTLNTITNTNYTPQVTNPQFLLYSLGGSLPTSLPVEVHFRLDPSTLVRVL